MALQEGDILLRVINSLESSKDFFLLLIKYPNIIWYLVYLIYLVDDPITLPNVDYNVL